MKPISKLAFAGIWFAFALAAQDVPVNPGPAVGARVPDFALVDQNGQTHSLHDLSGTNSLMLVFFRSADW